MTYYPLQFVEYRRFLFCTVQKLTAWLWR